MRQHTLLTGATGLIGRYLIRDLILAGESLCIVARPSKRETVAARLESIMHMWDRALNRRLPRPRVIEGEVTQAGLGLNDDDRLWVSRHCNKVLHNAAILDFYGPDRTGEPWQTNLNGTHNLLDFCRDLKLRDLHYVSTAYVCGDREGLIYEKDLDCGQGFRNDYEESKFLAEKAVRNCTDLEQLTIYRPAVVAGDSVTGYTSTYHGLYLYLKMISTVMRNLEPDADGVRRVKARWNCTGDELRNVVPVDWISAAMTRLFTTPAAHGGTYHLAPNNPMTPRQIIKFVDSYYNSAGLEFIGNNVPEQEMNDLEREGYAMMSIYASYATTDPRFDMTELNRFVGDMPCPEIDEAMVHRFIQYGEEDRWGKRRPTIIIPAGTAAGLTTDSATIAK